MVFLGHPVYRFNAKFVEINIKLEKEKLRIKKKHLKNLGKKGPKNGPKMSPTQAKKHIFSFICPFIFHFEKKNYYYYFFLI